MSDENHRAMQFRCPTPSRGRVKSLCLNMEVGVSFTEGSRHRRLQTSFQVSTVKHLLCLQPQTLLKEGRPSDGQEEDGIPSLVIAVTKTLSSSTL